MTIADKCPYMRHLTLLLGYPFARQQCRSIAQLYSLVCVLCHEVLSPTRAIKTYVMRMKCQTFCYSDLLPDKPSVVLDGLGCLKALHVVDLDGLAVTGTAA